MFEPDLPLRTARLVLRAFAPGDLDALHDTESRPEVTRYLPFDARDREASRRALARRIESVRIAAEGDALILAIVLPGTGAVAGHVMLRWLSREHRQGEVGYVLHPDHCGRGYATEAAAEMLRLGFDGFGLHRVIGRIDARNHESARVLERLGMRREAHFVQNEFLKGEWTDEVVYALLETEWRSRRPS